MNTTVFTGSPFPLGPTWDGDGVNFAIYSANAAGVTLCLFNHADDEKESVSIKLTEHAENVCHVYVLDGIGERG